MKRGSCAIASCGNCSTLTEGIIYHSFPKRDKLLCAKWESKCKRKNKFNLNKSQICSIHFKPEDYERDLRNELLGLPLRRILKPNSEPSLCLSTDTERSPEPTKIKIRIGRRKQYESPKQILKEIENKYTDQYLENDEEEMVEGDIVEERMKSDIVEEMVEGDIVEEMVEGDIVEERMKSDIVEEMVKTDIKEEMVDIKEEMVDVEEEMVDVDFLKHTSEQTNEEILQLKAEIEKLKEENLILKKNSRLKLKSLSAQVKYYKSKRTIMPPETEVKRRVQEILSSFLSPKQIEVILNKKKKVNWDDEDIAHAFSLKYHSKKAYLYLRNELNYPFPSLSTLKRWTLVVPADGNRAADQELLNSTP